MAEFVALSQLLAALRTATAGNKSGAFFITSPQQHSAMITLQRGRITGVKYRSVRGYDAARAIAEFPQVRFQTAAEPTELPGEEGLDTQAVLELLEKAEQGVEGAGGPGAGGGAAGDSEVGQDQLDRLRDRYIAAIGPIGGALFDEEYEALGARARTRTGYAQLVGKLAGQIDDPAESESFREDASLD